MSPAQYRIFTALAAGRPCSGQALAGQLGLSRAAVWKSVEQLRALGLGIRARAGFGYQIDRPVELLDPEAIRAHCDWADAHIRVLPGADSTNRALALVDRERRMGRVLLAECQTAGRGRRGRPWFSPPGAGLYLSMGWRFSSPTAQVGALGLIAGLATAEALEATAGMNVGLKWPNDLVVDDRKLGGCLVEISGLAEGPFDAIVGVGINISVPENPAIDQPWTDLAQEVGFTGRNRLAGAIISELRRRLEALEAGGFESQKADWDRRDRLRNVAVEVRDPRGGVRQGQSMGVSGRGGLRVRFNGRQEELMAGEVSIRAR